MPLASLVCPHCEQPVEVSVTNVTRSRECPACGRVIMLQFTTRSSRVKHKALLMTMTELEDAPAPGMVMAARTAGVSAAYAAPVAVRVPTGPVPAVAAYPAPQKITDRVSTEPKRVQEGTIHGHLEHDPEVKSSARNLAWGLGVVVILILIAVMGKALNWWDGVPKLYADFQKSLTLGSSAPAGEVAAMPDVTPTPAAPPLVAKVSDWDEEQDRAQQTLKTFLAAKDADERFKLVRDANTVEKAFKEFYTLNPAGPISFTRVALEESQPYGIHSYRFGVTLPSGEVRSMLVRRPAMGSPYEVDWASSVIYSEMAWDKFVQAKPTTPVMFRLLAKPDEHYNYHFLDAQRLICLKLTNPLDPKSPPLYGYCNRTSTGGRTLDFILRKNGSQPSKLMVKLKFPEANEKSEGNQVWIDEIITEGWTARGY